MAAFANITINDGAATPVAHTFGPNTLVGLVASYADRSGGISVGYPTIQITSQVPVKNSRLYKTRIRVTLPVLETVNASTWNGITPAPTKAYDMTGIIEFIAPERSTLQNRKDIRAFIKNLMADAIVTSLVETQETIF